MHAAAAAIEACPHPIVAQIHGLCVGGGLEIASLADLRICGHAAALAFRSRTSAWSWPTRSLSPLLRLVGPDRALEILLGRPHL